MQNNKRKVVRKSSITKENKNNKQPKSDPDAGQADDSHTQSTPSTEAAISKRNRNPGMDDINRIWPDRYYD